MRGVGVEAVLEHVEVDGRQIADVVVDGPVDLVKAPFVVAHRDPLEQIGERDHREAVELRHVGPRDRVGGGVEVVEVREQEAERVANAAVRFARAIEDLVGDADVLAVVGRGDPQAHDVGAGLRDHIDRRDRVAERLATSCDRRRRR